MENVGLGTAREALAALKNKVWSNQHDLSTSQRAVLEALIHFCDDAGETFVSVATTAARTHRSVGTVRRCIDALRSRGVVTTTIERTSRGRRLRYAVHLEALNGANAPAQNDRTRAITMIRSPRSAPSSDRIKFNGPPIAPLTGGERSVASASRNERKPDDETELVVARVLAFFVALLWPKAVGPAVTRSRRRLVLGRLRELQNTTHGDTAEQTLCDAVRGAQIHPWHREADQGRHARQVFRDLDKVEELAVLGRAKRLAEEREAMKRAGERPSEAPARSSERESNTAARSEGARALAALLQSWEEPSATTAQPSRVGTLTDAELAALRAADDRARTRVA